MKWIGQHIVDFIARFRSDVYLENIADGTVDSDKFLGLDSNNKIVKETVAAGVTISDSTANTDFPVVFHDESNNLHDDTGAFTYNPSTGSLSLANLLGPTDGDLNIKSDGGVFFTLDTDTDENNQMFTIAETSGQGDFQYNAGRGGLDISSSLGGYPTFTLTSTTDDFSGSFITLVNRRDGNGLEDNDVLGTISFQGDDAAGGGETYGSIVGSVVEADHGDEAGQIAIFVANDGTERNGITMTADKGTSEEVDVTIANGAASVTTIAGGLVVTTGRSVNVASEAQAPIGMQIARRTITTAEANAMNSTPIELVPAQGANTIIEVMNVVARVDRAANQTNGSMSMNAHYADKEPGTYGSASLAHFRRFAYGETTDFVERRVVSQTTSGLTLTEDVNKAVEVSFDAAATNNCFTSIDMYITYFVIDIS
jgi:hypothetical protein